MKRLVVATRNPGKLRELRVLLAGLELATLADYPEVGDVEETGKTFEANASLKATHAAVATGSFALGEDSGLEVDALGGAPGVYSARFSGRHGDDAANNQKLIDSLADTPEADRGARYVCALALAAPDGSIVELLRATSEGRITRAPRGSGGFGYDPYFVPEGETRTNAELTPTEKDALSHRGRAVRDLLPRLRRHMSS